MWGCRGMGLANNHPIAKVSAKGYIFANLRFPLQDTNLAHKAGFFIARKPLPG